MIKSLMQWYNQNLHRSYPLAQTAFHSIPDTLLADIRIYVPSQLLQAQQLDFYVSRVRSDGTTMQIYISAALTFQQDQQQTVFTDILCAYGIPTSIAIQDISDPTRYPLTLSTDYTADSRLQALSGSIVLGQTLQYAMPQQLQLQRESHIIDTICLVPATDSGITAILVNGTALTGTITLEAGQGITLSVDQQTNTITIQTAEAPQLQQALAQIKEELGTPVTSINGISPDQQGQIKVQGLDCTVVQPLGNVLTISNPCSKPCCGQATSSDTAAALKVVQQSIQVLRNYYVSVSTAVNIMASRLSMVINRGATWQSS